MVPGFRGYSGGSLSADDQLIRKKVSLILDEARLRVERLEFNVKRKNVSLGLRLDDLRIELMKASQLLKQPGASSPGKASIDDESLQRLLEEDLKLISTASRIFERVVALTPALEPKEFLEKVNEAISLVVEAENVIRERDNLLKRVLLETP